MSLKQPGSRVKCSRESSPGLSRVRLAILISLPLLLFFLSLFCGRYWVSPGVCLQVLAAKLLPFLHIEHTWSGAQEAVIWQIRLPRAVLAMMVGAALSISGASFQGMFRNPLVSPDLLGVSAGAGFGACLAIMLDGNQAMIQAFAFCFGLLAVVTTYLISRVYKSTPVLMLVLAGVAISALFSAFISVTKYLADPYSKLPEITFWLMGSLAKADMAGVAAAAAPILVGSLGLLLVSWRINLLSMGDEEARSLGVNTELLKGIVIVCCTLATAAAVCSAGIVGWVGMVIPHIGRMLVGPDHRRLLPTSIALGAGYLLVMDDIARTASALEIPLGILTAIIGAPFFIYMLRKSKGGWT